MVLITALLYLYTITFLATSAFSTSVLQAKISTRFYAEMQAFTQAESALRVGESKIRLGQESGEGRLDETSSYQFTKHADTACGVVYAVSVIGSVATAHTQLESIFIFPIQPLPDICKEKDAREMPHRVVWYQVGGMLS